MFYKLCVFKIGNHITSKITTVLTSFHTSLVLQCVSSPCEPRYKVESKINKLHHFFLLLLSISFLCFQHYSLHRCLRPFPSAFSFPQKKIQQSFFISFHRNSFYFCAQRKLVAQTPAFPLACLALCRMLLRLPVSHTSILVTLTLPSAASKFCVLHAVSHARIPHL